MRDKIIQCKLKEANYKIIEENVQEEGEDG